MIFCTDSDTLGQLAIYCITLAFAASLGSDLHFPTEMSSMPYAMHMAVAEKKRQEKQKKAKANLAATNVYETNFENPTMYSSKMMNSIWGMYNKYSVHNFKSKQCDIPDGKVTQGSSSMEQQNRSMHGGDSNLGGNNNNYLSGSFNNINNCNPNFVEVASEVATNFSKKFFKFQ